jgi:UDP-N-acetylglucosamine/UDP-N-acetylgalactosamine diphosphorylase
VLKVQDEADQLLVAKTYEAQQEHVFAHWEGLDEAARQALLEQLRGVDFRQLEKLAKLIDSGSPADLPDITPPALEVPSQERRAELAEIGWAALREGKVACLVVAGGQGTRLGWDAPKGTYPVGPITGKTLYHLFAEQIRAVSHRAGAPLRWYVLTSVSNEDQTKAFFAEQQHFGLDPAQITFLCQRQLPVTDARGLLLLEDKGRIATSPNGHGGTFFALRDGGAIEQMQADGVEHLFYWQVDNPLCPVADPVFLGAHIEAGAEASSKVVVKEDPAERIGLVVERGGRPCVVEYSEVSAEQQAARDEDGQLTFRAGSIAVHVFDRAFLARLIDEGFELDYHVARKAVTALDAKGEVVKPDKPNACKFETFIFELLPQATTHVTFPVERAEEFEPLKNAEGLYSPQTVKQAISARGLRWLRAAGAKVEGVTRWEVSPLTAYDAGELAGKMGELSLEPSEGGLSI